MREQDDGGVPTWLAQGAAVIILVALVALLGALVVAAWRWVL